MPSRAGGRDAASPDRAGRAHDLAVLSECVDVAGIGAVRQGRQPALYRFGVDPLGKSEALSFAQSGVKAIEAEFAAAGQASNRDTPLQCGELEGERLQRSRK